PSDESIVPQQPELANDNEWVGGDRGPAQGADSGTTPQRPPLLPLLAFSLPHPTPESYGSEEAYVHPRVIDRGQRLGGEQRDRASHHGGDSTSIPRPPTRQDEGCASRGHSVAR